MFYVFQDLCGEKVTADHATSLLDKMFSSKSQQSIVLLVDEVC